MDDIRHLIIFIKNPVLGKAKTRLAATIGEQKALEVYLKLLEITRNVTLKSDCVKHVFYSDEIETDAWDSDTFNKHLQEGSSLGERMKNAFNQVFALGAKKAVIIGSDCPELNEEIIENAFKLLDVNEVAIGPAKDGGYYLIGMKQPLSFIFENKKWSTDSVFNETINDLTTNKLSFGLTLELSDLDTIDDLNNSSLNYLQ